MNKCVQYQKQYQSGYSKRGCPKCAPGVVISESEFQKPFTKAQLHRLYVNSPELHKDAPSEAAFTRIVQLTEKAHGIGGGGK